MDAGASGNGMVIARGRPEDRPVVILVGAFQHGSGDPVAARLTAHVTVVRHDRRARGGSGGRAPSPAGREAGELKALIDGAASVVLVFGAWPGAVLAVDGPLIRRLALGEPALATDGGRPPPPAGSVAGVAGAELGVRLDLGDAGELLDATAKASYKARLDDLRAELEEAERFNDPVRAANVRQERDFLVGELARAVGLGGRDRRAASHAERARLNVTRAIRAAVANLARANPALGAHLAAMVRTGRYCSYTPDPRAPITWEL